MNFFPLAPPAGLHRQLSLVDMPGYGFALAKAEVIQNWANAMKVYLEERRTLKRLLLLLDGRHGFKQIDREFITYLEASLPRKTQFCIVLTKCDLVPTKDLARRVTSIEQELGGYRKALPHVVLVSKKSPKSIKVLQKQIMALSAPVQQP